MYSFYEIFPDRGDWEVYFFAGGGVLIFERMLRVELFGWGRVIFSLYSSLC